MSRIVAASFITVLIMSLTSLVGAQGPSNARSGEPTNLSCVHKGGCCKDCTGGTPTACCSNSYHWESSRSCNVCE